MKGYTKIPNDLLNSSQLSIGARYLFCVLLRHCGKDDSCFPSQHTLGKIMNLSDRHIRNLLNELLLAKILVKKRIGWNRANTYTLTKTFTVDRKGISYHLGSAYPLQQGKQIPDKKTYLKGKGKRSLLALEKMREELLKKKII